MNQALRHLRLCLGPINRGRTKRQKKERVQNKENIPARNAREIRAEEERRHFRRRKGQTDLRRKQWAEKKLPTDASLTDAVSGGEREVREGATTNATSVSFITAISGETSASLHSNTDNRTCFAVCGSLELLIAGMEDSEFRISLGKGSTRALKRQSLATL
ncbi:hypothetical protein U1Q18_039824 [Sarracenia purpurea var. burkii]